jgi:hypothetical protein
MNQVTVVDFKAFDRTSREFFVDESEPEIEKKIKDVCNTAVILKVTTLRVFEEKLNFDHNLRPETATEGIEADTAQA